MQTGLDHILIAARDLEEGCDVIEAATGVRPAFGGVHPGRGTRNALASLGPGAYLEVIAPDPEQSVESDLTARLRSWDRPGLAWWAARTSDLSALRARLSAIGVESSAVKAGSRDTPEGKRIAWSTLYLGDTPSAAAVPFLINWGETAHHPSATAPKAGRFVALEIGLPEPSSLDALLEVIGRGADVIVRQTPSAVMTARIETTAGGRVELSTPAAFPPAFPPRT